MRVLLVEDDKYIAKATAEILKKNKYSVDMVYNGEDGLDCALSDVYDIVILDIMLPKKDGLAILREIRDAGIDVPVILLTAKGLIEDKVKGLDLGADDYLPKPFHPDELLARLRALGRRKPEFCNAGILSVYDIQLSPHTLVLSCGGRETKIKLKEAQLLELFISNRNHVISKDTIIEKVWGYDADTTENQVESYISRIRKALSQIQSKTRISVIRGAGYTLSEGE